MSAETALLTVEQAARKLGVSRSFFYDKILTRGLIPRVQLGRSVRFRPADLDVLVERITTGEVSV